MNCPIGNDNNSDVLLAYCARKLDPDSVAILERHMAACADCASFRDLQQSVWSALDSWEAPPVSEDFDRRLYARIEAADAESWYRRTLDYLSDAFRPLIRRPAFPLAAAGVLVVAGFVFDHRTPGVGVPVEPHSPQVNVSTNEVEQVERTLDDMEMLHQFDRVSKDDSKDSKTM